MHDVGMSVMTQTRARLGNVLPRSIHPSEGETGRVGNEDAPAMPGRVVKSETSVDGPRRRLDFLVYPDRQPEHHVAIRIDLMPDREPMLWAGFAAEVREVCLPEHLDPQEEVVGETMQVLRRIPDLGDPEPLVSELGSRWAEVRARLEARQAEIAADGLLAQRVELDTHPPNIAPIVTCPVTRIARRDPAQIQDRSRYGIRYAYGKLKLVEQRNITILPATGEALSSIANMTGHEKLALLSNSPQLLDKLRAGFLSPSKNTRPRAVPIAREGWIAWNRWDVVHPGNQEWEKGLVQAHGPHGARADIQIIGYGREERSHLRLIAYGQDRNSLEIRLGNVSGQLKPFSIVRRHGRPAFPTVEALDAMVRLAIEVLCALDLNLTGLVLGPGHVLTDDEVSAHPLLEGRNLPRRLRPFLGKVLADPYESARTEAAKQAARSGRKAAKRAAMRRMTPR